MASWKKHFKPVSSVLPTTTSSGSHHGANSSVNNYNNWLPEVYEGPPDRLQRYAIYESMDYDHEVHAALDTLADFSTEADPLTSLPFTVDYADDPSATEVTLINKTLKQWCSINEFDERLWGMFRGTLQYGDQFLVRDPDTFKLMWCDPNKITKVVVNESEGKKIEIYTIKDMDLNLSSMVATNQSDSSPQVLNGATISGAPTKANMSASINTLSGQSASGKFSSDEEHPVDASYVVQMSLSDGMSATWPFGTSVLEFVYKVFKQKEMLEDSILIYRIHRAPERRVFTIDAGNIPANKANKYLEQMKYEIQQKRIPSRSGGSSSVDVTDSAYNPLCLDLDTHIPLLDGRTLDLHDLIAEYKSGKENWVYSCDPITGEILPGNITWAGVTRENAETIEIILDNGRMFICTPDHKIPVMGRGFVEAKDLTTTDKLIGFETKQDKGFTTVFDPSDNTWKHSHEIVGNHFKKCKNHQEFTFRESMVGKEKNTIHHKDFNRFNNEPKNIQWMNRDDHADYIEFVDNIDNTPSELDNIITPAKQNNRIKSIRKVANRDTGTITVDGDERWNPHHTFAIESGIFVKNSTMEDYFFLANPDTGRGSKVETLPGGDNLGCFALDTSIKLADGSDLTILEIEKELSDGKELWTYSCHPTTGKLAPGIITWAGLTRKDAKVIKLNLSNGESIVCTPDHKFPIKGVGFVEAKDLEVATELMSLRLDESNGVVYCNETEEWHKPDIFADYGIKDINVTGQLDDFINIASIEHLDEVMDVGTLTVDIDEVFHDYHTYSLSVGVFVKNSIDDLLYFNNKMLRALGIPSSYLPSGPNDGGTSMSDGRVGTAFIQEFRFSKVCERYQKQLIKPLDKEFKLFMKSKGIEIDSSLFNLKFPEPQSFSEYRQLELDAAQINVFSSMTQVPYISKRFALKRYLGMSEEEIKENEKLWVEEQGNASNAVEPSADLSAAGITSSGIDGMAPDEGFEDSGDDLSMDDFATDEFENDENDIEGFGN